MSQSRPRWVCLNGELVPAETAKVSVHDTSYQRGLGVFETMLGVKQKVPLLEQHWQRLQTTCKQFQLAAPSLAQLATATDSLLKKNAFDYSRIRLTISGADSPESRWYQSPGNSSWSMLCVPIKKPMSVDKGIRVTTWPGVIDSRCIPTGYKTTSYLPMVVCRRYAADNNFDEALVQNENAEWAECSASNLFVVIDQKIKTPDESSGCLPGIMRNLVIETAQKLGLNIETAKLNPDCLPQLSFAFTTNAIQGLTPIYQIDDHSFGTKPEWWNVLTQDISRQLQLG